MMSNAMKKVGFKYYGPETKLPSADGRGLVAISGYHESGLLGGDPERLKQTTEEGPGGSLKAIRGPVPNRIALLPVYVKKDLLELLCWLLPRCEHSLREACEFSEASKYVSVVDFTEDLALCLQDLEKDKELIKDMDPVVFWMDIQDKLQQLAEKRLLSRRVNALLYDTGGWPYSNVESPGFEMEEREAEGSVKKSGSGSGSTPEEEDEQQRQDQGGDIGGDEDEPGRGLRLIIPKDEIDEEIRAMNY